MPAIYTRGGDTLNENILLKIFAFDDSASDARTPCIARGWDAVRRGPPLLITVPGSNNWRPRAVTISPDQSTVAVATTGTRLYVFDAATGQLRRSISLAHWTNNRVGLWQLRISLRQRHG